MIAYNRTSLDNKYIHKQSDEAFSAGCISDEENKKIRAAYPTNLYTPNIFICIGLFLLTVLIAMCSLGLLLLIDSGSTGSVNFLLIFSGMVCYAALEFVIYNRRHFRSGVDTALIWMSAGLLFAGFFMIFENMSNSFQCVVIFMISLLFTIRFSNYVMALVTYSALLGFVFNITPQIVRIGLLVTPFILMAVSAAIWLLSVRLLSNETLRHYRQCLTAVKAASLIGFYLAGNYFIVREMAGFIIGNSRHSEVSISMSWFFWILTAVTPLLYLYRGIRKKDQIFLWVGLALTAATIFTVRYYYNLLPLEWAMMLGGIAIIAITYGLIKYLKIPKHGFTSMESSDKHLLENLHIESLVIAETFAGTSAAPANDFQFGGGSGGGGGAGGQYR